MLLGRLETSLWLRDDNEEGATIPEKVLKGLFMSRKFRFWA